MECQNYDSHLIHIKPESFDEIKSMKEKGKRFTFKPFHTQDKFGYSLVLYFDSKLSDNELESKVDDNNKLVFLALTEKGKDAFFKHNQRNISCQNGNYSFFVLSPYWYCSEQ